MQKSKGIKSVARLLLICLSLLGVTLLSGCSRFDAAAPLWEEYSSTDELSRDMGAFVKWCGDEIKGNPESMGP